MRAENSISRLPEIAFSALATACISFSPAFSQSEARIGFFVFVFMFLIKERVTEAKPWAVECGVGVDGATDWFGRSGRHFQAGGFLSRLSDVETVALPSR